MPVIRTQEPRGTCAIGKPCASFKQRVVKNGREELAVGGEYKLVLNGAPHLRHHLSFDRDQVELMPNRLIDIPVRQLPPGRRYWRNCCPRPAILDLAVVQRQQKIVRIWKAGCVRNVAYLEGAASTGIDPKALGAILQHDGRARFVICDGSVNANSLRQIVHMIRTENLIEGRNREGPRTCGAFENLDVCQGLSMESQPDQLHFVVEVSRFSSRELYFGAQRAFRARFDRRCLRPHPCGRRR